MNTFEKATKLKLRFETAKGNLSVEELWDLSLESLDTIARAVNKRLKEATEESFLNKRPSATTTDHLRLEVLKQVIETKQTEADNAKVRAEKKQQLEFLTSLLDKKKMDKMESMSAAAIEKQIAALQSEI